MMAGMAEEMGWDGGRDAEEMGWDDGRDGGRDGMR